MTKQKWENEIKWTSKSNYKSIEVEITPLYTNEKLDKGSRQIVGKIDSCFLPTH